MHRLISLSGLFYGSTMENMPEAAPPVTVKLFPSPPVESSDYETSPPLMSLTWSLQALLIRHEAYVAEAEKEKARMVVEIEQLTAEKNVLEARNVVVVEENRNLLDQLENVNNAVCESDLHIESLNATLQSTQAELHRLNNLATRTDSLERELQVYEQEQTCLHATLESKTEEERAATLRWQHAQRKLAAMEDQLERIEQAAAEERERHVEVIARIERQRLVEKELETSGGRLPGAAATKLSIREKHSSGVVSHFVKDILQDNANLQLGIVELRDLLTNSNDEVERLREQLAQPLLANQDLEIEPLGSRRASTLNHELSRASAQELHVHHHYHAPSNSVDPSRRQGQTLRRPKKKRQGLTSGVFTPSSGTRTPRSSISGVTSIAPSSSSMFTPSSSAAILSHTAVTVPNSNVSAYRSNRWSMQSGFTAESSMASSPRSTTTYQPSSLFDRGLSDAGMDSSRPTTPDSETPGSPLFVAFQPKRGSAGYFRSIPALPFRHGNPDDPSSYGYLQDNDAPDMDLELSRAGHDAILEEDEQDLLATNAASTYRHSSQIPTFADDTAINTRPTTPQDLYSRTHRRASSHESLISISGMDIHTLKSRPSQLLLTAHKARSFSSQPVVSATIAHAARPVLMPRASDDSRTRLLTEMAADQRSVSANATVRPTLGKKVGGWVFGRWGSSPAAPTITVSTPSTGSAPRTGQRPAVFLTAGAATYRSPSPYKLRPPGINQSGPILGFGPEPMLPREPIVTTAPDEAALQEVLNDS